MNPWDTLTRLAHSAWSAITGIPGDVASAGASIWRFITSVAQVVDFVVSNPLMAIVLATQGLAALLTGNMEAWRNAGNRLSGYIWGTQVAPVQSDLLRRLRALRRWTAIEIRGVYHWTALQIMGLRDWVNRLMAAERAARIRGDQQAEAYARQLVAMLHQVIEREAASGYRLNRKDRLGLLVKVLDLAAGRDPAVRAVTSRAAGIILDLLAVDDPLARLLAGFLIREVIKHLGVDKAIGDLAGALAGPILGEADPRDLHGVVADVSARLLALEDQWATFMEDGGAQVLQAGESWRDITSLITDAGILAFGVAAVTSPAATASDLAGLIRPVGTSTIDAIANLLAGR